MGAKKGGLTVLMRILSLRAKLWREKEFWGIAQWLERLVCNNHSIQISNREE